jgi:hypothetical protein
MSSHLEHFRRAGEVMSVFDRDYVEERELPPLHIQY